MCGIASCGTAEAVRWPRYFTRGSNIDFCYLRPPSPQCSLWTETRPVRTRTRSEIFLRSLPRAWLSSIRRWTRIMEDLLAIADISKRAGFGRYIASSSYRTPWPVTDIGTAVQRPGPSRGHSRSASSRERTTTNRSVAKQRRVEIVQYQFIFPARRIPIFIAAVRWQIRRASAVIDTSKFRHRRESRGVPERNSSRVSGVRRQNARSRRMEREARAPAIPSDERRADHEDLLDHACRRMRSPPAVRDHKSQCLVRRGCAWAEYERARKHPGHSCWRASSRYFRKQ